MPSHRIRTLLAAALLFVCNIAFGAFSKYVTLTVTGYTGNALTDYPALVKIDSTRIPGIYSEVKNNGMDLEFTDYTGEVKYPYEVDTWNPSGVSYVWVKLPSFKSGVDFRMYYGDVTKTENPTASDVWSAFDLVCHLNDGSASDSTANHVLGAVNPVASSVAGVLGGGLGTSAAKQGPVFENWLYPTANKGEALADGVFTVSCWVKYNGTPVISPYWPNICGVINGWGLFVASTTQSQISLQTVKGSAATYTRNNGFIPDNWFKLDAIYRINNGNNQVTLYVNGSSAGGWMNLLAPSLGYHTWLGWGGASFGSSATPQFDNPDYSFAASFDECRVFSEAMSAYQLSADYALVTRDDIFSFSEPKSGINTHRNRVVNPSATEQVTVFCEDGFYDWVPPANACNFKMLIVGGGGGGASSRDNSGGGGGGGEVKYLPSVDLHPFQHYHMRVAPGGVGDTNKAGVQAYPSYFYGDDFDQVSAQGGGAGGGNYNNSDPTTGKGGVGVNGGGGGGYYADAPGGLSNVPGGHIGGVGAGKNKGGGGGGMAENGYAGDADTNRGNGGAGVVYDISGEDVMYGYGGGGYGAYSGRYAFSEGPNGYGDGHGKSGEIGTGGGGGGGGTPTTGGSGTVIIRYTMQNFPATVTVGVTKQSDSTEAGLVPGGFTFTCSESARSVDFPVHYAVSGTAKSGQTYKPLYGTAVIPAGVTSVTIPVYPLSDNVTDVNSTVIVTIIPEDIYSIGSSSSATVTIVNDPGTSSEFVRYVSTTGSDDNDGRTVATAYQSIHKAVHDFDAADHGTVYVLPGTYKLKGYDYKSCTGYSAVEITNAVSLIGAGAAPSNVVVTLDTSSGQSNVRRLFYMSHPKAKILNLNLDAGRIVNICDASGTLINSPGCGGNLHIGKDGGLVQDCLFTRGCDAHWAGGGCNIYMADGPGRVSRCVITGGYGANNRDPATNGSYPKAGTAVCAYGGIIENCLIYGNGKNVVSGDNNGCTVGLWGYARMINCTVTDNYSDYCAGVAVRTKTARVLNCLFFNNHALQGTTDHSDVWVSLNNDDSYSVDFSGCIADRSIDERQILTDNPGFVDPIKHDYHITVASPCRDASVDYVGSGAISLTDLDGSPRRMGSNEDVGCYEFDPSTLSCDFYADITVSLLDKVHGGTTIKFTAIVEGSHTGSLHYHWDFNGDGVFDQTTTSPEISYKYTNCGDNGYFTVKLKVTDDSTHEASMSKTDYIHLAPMDLYIDPASTGGEFPWDTPAKAGPNLYTVLPATLDGSVVHVAKGTYVYDGTHRPQIDHGIKVLGETENPYDTLFDYQQTGNKNAMHLVVNHPDALVANICFQGGRNHSDGNASAGIRITGSGGTVSNCVVRKCVVTGAQLHGGVWMTGGTLTHSIIEDNTQVTLNEEGGYSGNSNSRREQALFVNGPAVVENCLIRNCKTETCLVILQHAEAVMRNCTVIDCQVSFFTENPRPVSPPAINYACPRIQWPAYGILCVDGLGKVYNTVIFNVKRRSFYDIKRDITWPETTAPFCRLDTWRGISESAPFPNNPFAADNGHCVNCASDAVGDTTDPDKRINDTCFLIDETDFVDYANGDFTPREGGRLHDVGASLSGWNKRVDLAGNPRVMGKKIDIGCYEQQHGEFTADDIFVDCLYNGANGPSDGSVDAPWKTIKEGCEHAETVGTRIFVRGGPDREYVFTNYLDNAAFLAVDKVSLVGCDSDWNPATGYFDTNAMATVVIADDYASKSYAKAGNKTTWNAPITVQCDECVVSGIRGIFGNKSLSQDGRGGNGLIEIAASKVTVENCWFRMKDTYGAYGGSCAAGIIYSTPLTKAADPRRDNCTIRSCYAWIGSYRGGNLSFFCNLHNNTRIEKCLLENVSTLFRGGCNTGLDTEYHIVSNVFRNCNGMYDLEPGYKSWFISNCNNYCPTACEVAYNIAVHDNGVPGCYMFLQHGISYGGTLTKDVAIHHNTIIGYDVAFSSPLYNNSANGSMWTPQIFDNLIVNTPVLFDESAVAVWKNGAVDCHSSFKPGSMFRNNALLCDDFVTGTATDFSWYDIGENLAGTNTTMYLTAPPIFVNVTDVTSENYFKMKVPQCPWVINAWTGDDPLFQEFPRYVGAVAPQPGGFAVRIR